MKKYNKFFHMNGLQLLFVGCVMVGELYQFIDYFKLVEFLDVLCPKVYNVVLQVKINTLGLVKLL